MVDETQILMYENFDLENIITLVRPDKLNYLLKKANYNPEKRKFIVAGFTEGFSLGYENEQKVQVQSNNLKFTIGNEVELWNKVMKEVKLKRYAGPYPDIPQEFQDDFIQSPIGLVPKDDGKETRLIFHLSHPRKPKDGIPSSVNANTPRHLCSITYPEFNDAVLRCLQEGTGCFVAKSDFRSAFRILCIMKKYWRYLIMKAKCPIDGKWYYFVDKCLPFGASISCALFQEVSDAIAHLVYSRTNKEIVNYLDDFLFAALLKYLCDQQVSTFLQICEEIGFPVVEDKTFWGNTIMTFLGFLIDTVNQIIGIPRDKISKALNMLDHVLAKRNKPSSKRKITILQLQQICSFLNFLAKVVIPGWAFTRHLYDQLAKHHHLKTHHHIKISEDMMLDFQMWRNFVRHPSVFCRPFLDITKTWTSVELEFFSDA